MSSWEIINEVTTAIGVTYRSIGFEYTDKYISLGGKEAYDETALFPLNTTGFNALLKVYNKNNQIALAKKQYIMVDPDKETLTLYGYGAEKTVSLKDFNDGLRTKYATSNMMIDLSDLTTTLQTGNISIKLILQNYGYKNPEYKVTNNQNEYLKIAGYALVKG